MQLSLLRLVSYHSLSQIMSSKPPAPLVFQLRCSILSQNIQEAIFQHPSFNASASLTTLSLILEPLLQLLFPHGILDTRFSCVSHSSLYSLVLCIGQQCWFSYLRISRSGRGSPHVLVSIDILFARVAIFLNRVLLTFLLPPMNRCRFRGRSADPNLASAISNSALMPLL